MRQTLKQIKKIEIKTKKLVDGLIAGNYHSVFKGNGIEFSEIRQYEFGDDIRTIDWKVTARLNEPFVKEFIEERDLSVYFVIDVSGSGNFGDNIEKRRKSIELVATLMFSALRNNDNISLCLSTDEVELFVPPKKGKRHVLKILDLMLTHKPMSKKTDLHSSLKFISKIAKRRGVIFVVSDFLNAGDFMNPLKIMRNKQDIIAIKISERKEKEIPDVGLIELEDEETGEQILLDTSNKEFRKRYSELVKSHENKLLALFRKYRIGLIEILTEEDYEKPLKRFFKMRNLRSY